MRKSLLILFVFVSALAWGSPVPTFNITQGSATVTADPQGLVAGLVSFQFSGNGFSIVGSGSIACNFCVNSAPPGLGPLDAGMTIFADPFNTGGAAIFLGNGVQYQSALFSGLSFTSGTSFSLPSGSQSTFSIVLPVTLSGSVVAYGNCDFTILSCPTPIGTFNVNSKGTATINYTNQDGAWFFSSAAFTLSLSSSGTRNNEFVGYWLGGSRRLDPAKATLSPAAKLETTKCGTGVRLVCTSTPFVQP